jgi:heme exporter protein D
MGSYKDGKVMDQIRDFINMEGYGGYVWPSYLVTAGLMIILLVITRRFLKANMATLEALENTAKEDVE